MMRKERKSINLRSLLIKIVVLYIIFNMAFMLFSPLEMIGKISLYNRLFPGRLRLPYGDNPTKSYNLTLSNLEAMFASHEISSRDKTNNEYRVVLIGDSSIWGFLLPADKTLSSQLNAFNLELEDGRKVHVYNLGYPVMSLAKDLILLKYALQYKPDLIVWSVTLESFPYDKQLFSPLLQQNASLLKTLIDQYQLPLEKDNPSLRTIDLWGKTIIGVRRELADIIRLQLYGVMWAATGIDQHIPPDYTPAQKDFEADESFHDLQPPELQASDLALEILAAGHRMAGDIPILIINEPVFISDGKNSHIRYNFFYPRWAYDSYRKIIQSTAEENGWYYYDLWNTIDNHEFTNTAIHLSEKGTYQYAAYIKNILLQYLYN